MRLGRSCKKMKKIIVLLVLGLSLPALAGYEISWYTVDGGGGVSSSEQYGLTGTAGQADAGYSAGGQYEVLGGFWPGGPLCIVDFESFARFAEYWLEMGAGLPADLYEDEYDIVDGFDLQVFVEQWLYYCPLDWPLR